MPQTPTENPIANHPINLGDFRRVTAGLPDSTPICNDVVEGPREWTAGIVSIEAGIPKHWQGVQGVPDGIYVHVRIHEMDGISVPVEMEGGGPDEPETCDECGAEYPDDAPDMNGPFHSPSCSLYCEPE